ncbi:MAG TPA: dihydropteroate synthase [Solirubrobacteraceae bacterium]|nr:dihydropteroate synthase [Solirubrobacteraceae bacterium]
MSPRRYSLRAGERLLELGERPLLMGVVNASPDSFSDHGAPPTRERCLALAREQVAAGAAIVDVGGESARTNLPAISEQEEIERVAPVIAAIAAELETVISVDTYKPAVAAAAIEAGAGVVNDVSGLREQELARVCARTGAALVVMHTRAAPKERLQDPELYGGDMVGEVLGFLGERIERARAAGVSLEQLIVDPGPDFAKTPAQTIALLREAARLHELGRPLLMAISRKDFIGALTSRPPRERLAGTLAALAHGLDCEAQIFRVHDVAAARDFIQVRRALRGELLASGDLTLAEELRAEARAAQPR